ncbi:nitric oxide-sensing protein NosP [Denitromonas iodatirespirans]|uniref:FIST C-terminal domain-containing protein n=1 Tax=Denitromonas iodatirespirans TaxID=2795389 RepID=A0A944DAT7_DENI1|nr:nitric oxide-sensing protein NosP [Denitromonas iodatirespirans]MBT0961037.1 FIST C-terminal domain-containing protein [Denitromonas iodatirespirans]
MPRQSAIRLGHSLAQDARLAAQEFHAAVAQDDAALVAFFCSSLYDLDALADEMARLFAGIPVIGCTTAGEIGPAGYCRHSLSGVSFSAAACSAVVGRVDALQQFHIADGQDFATDLLGQLKAQRPAASGANTFGMLLIDGLSIREESVAHTLQSALGSISIVGGSAGDDLKFSRTWIYHDGAFHTDCAVLALVNTELPFMAFKTQHFVTEEERLVVTEADADRRIVYEINGLPAAEEYARLVGTTAEGLGPDQFAAHPIVVLIDGTDYVRSIQKVNADGSLTFYCAIEEGLVLRVARGQDIVDDLDTTLARIREVIGPPEFIFSCDCILRHLEMEARQQRDAVAELLIRNNTIGFSTYGEQYGGVHINQTLTGIAIGRSLETGDA